MVNRSSGIGLTSFQLKCVAILSMVFDHSGAILFPDQLWMRYIGRIAFPVFCFLIVEGCYYTHDIRKYLIRLASFAVVSEIPFDLAFNGSLLEFRHQNVFFTLATGAAMLWIFRYCREWPEKMIVLLIMMWIAEILRSDYSYRGILLIFVFYIFRSNRILAAAAGAFWNLLYKSSIQIYGILAMLPILLYNGREGRKMKYFFYLFYPFHLLILYAVRLLVFRT